MSLCLLGSSGNRFLKVLKNLENFQKCFKVLPHWEISQTSPIQPRNLLNNFKLNYNKIEWMTNLNIIFQQVKDRNLKAACLPVTVVSMKIIDIDIA